MKKIIISYYLKTVVLAVAAAAAITCIVLFLISYFRIPNDNLPQYYIHKINSELKRNQSSFFLSDEATSKIRNNNYWLQVIDKNGNSVFKENVPEEIPSEYTNIELVNIVSESDRLEGYTVFITEYNLESDKQYCILLGCKSDIVKKLQFHTGGGLTNNIFFNVAFVFFIASIISISIAAYIFSKNVCKPITAIVDSIQNLAKENIIKNSSAENNGLFKDIFFNLHRLEIALNENRESRDRWISNITHDIKTPLSTIKGYAELMLNSDYCLEKAEVEDYANEIINSSLVIEELAEDLKLYQTLAEGKCSLKYEKIFIKEFLRECIDESKISKKAEDTIILNNENDVSFFADKKLIKRSIINIICNSFIHNHEPVNVVIHFYIQSNNLFITIADNGRGLSKTEKSHLFERYYRGTGTDKIKGSGLGLSIANEVINAHGGSIEVNTPEKGGVSFIIIIPRDRKSV